ncbi:hypothetical protein ABEB36_008945 [Hypothenemus hampei]|uniref:Uncharacterized protein n=1 Tax=Hypothenemus hampei TaxID=57062 RepID=A0ABD1ERJ5_HYPHA
MTSTKFARYIFCTLFVLLSVNVINGNGATNKSFQLQIAENSSLANNSHNQVVFDGSQKVPTVTFPSANLTTEPGEDIIYIEIALTTFYQFRYWRNHRQLHIQNYI